MVANLDFQRVCVCTQPRKLIVVSLSQQLRDTAVLVHAVLVMHKQ